MSEEDFLKEYIKRKEGKEGIGSSKTDQEELEREKRRREEQKRSEQKKRQKEESARNSDSTSNPTKQGAYYGNVLGLVGKVTMSDVKKKYRELVSQYHPDKVNHLGEKLKKLAEVEMKEINEAYEYFKRMYE